MRWPFRRTRRPAFAELAAAGVRTESDAEYRRARIDGYIAQMADRSKKKVAELEEFLDAWLILEVEADGQRRYLPAPGWDLEEALLTRDSYETEDEAIAQVAALGGVLRPHRGRA